MSDIIEPLTPAPSFLDENLAGTDTTFPVIRGPVTLEVEIVAVTEVQAKDNPTGMNLLIQVKTVRDTQSTRGESIGAGFPLSKYIGVTETLNRPGKKDYDATAIRRALAGFMEAVDGTASAIKPLERWVGKRVMGKVTVSPATEKYPNESNSIQFVKRS